MPRYVDRSRESDTRNKPNNKSRKARNNDLWAQIQSEVAKQEKKDVIKKEKHDGL